MGRTFTILLCFLISTGFLFAGTTGKIAGKVTDGSTGEPLVGANVVIVGSAMGAAVDLDGDFYIINVPPGIYTLEVSMMGYATTQLTEVTVQIDRTTPVEVELTSATLETEEITVVASRVNVRQDVSSSEAVATKEQIDLVPVVRDITQYMALQPGIQLNADEEGREIFIRGGGQDQIGMVVDGLVLNNNLTGSSNDEVNAGDGGALLNLVNLSAIQEVSVVRGGFNAEYGNIRSGLFNIVTKEGARKTTGSLDTRYTFARQKHRGPNIYDWESYWVRPYVDPAVAWVGTSNGGWDEYTRGQYRSFEGWNAFVDKNPDLGLTAEEARDLYIWQHALKGSGDLGHPHEGNYGDNPDYMIDASLNGPVPFLSDFGNLRYFLSYRLNNEQYTYAAQLDAVTTNNFMAKINFDPTANMKVGLEALIGKTETAGGATGAENDRGAYFLHNSSPLDIYSRVYGVTFDHVLSPKTYYKARVSYVELENDQNKARTFRDTRILNTFGSISVDEQPWGFLDDPGYVYAIADQAVIGGVGGEAVNLNKVSTWNLKVDLTSQLNKYNQVQAGIEFIVDKMDIYDEIDGFDPTGAYLNEWTAEPFRIQGYIQDKLEFNDFVANVGLRLDYNDPNAVFYGADPYSKYFSRVYKSLLTTEAPTSDAEGHWRLSPRLGVAHPITNVSKLFFNYGHFYDMAGAFDRHMVHYGIESSGIFSIGNPSLLPRKTIAYELGYEHEIAEQWLIRLTGYYRDVTSQIGQVNYQNFDASVNYSTYSNDEFADTRGFEIEVRKDWGNWVTGWINYTYMVESGGLIGFGNQFQDPRLQAIEARRNPSEEFEKPLPQPYATANIRVMSPANWGPALGDVHILDRLSLNTLVTWSTGDYWSYPILPGDQANNNLQWKDFWNVDLRISKYFDAGPVSFDLFLDIINVFDLKYMSPGGFSDEDDVRDYVYSLHLDEYAEPRYQGDSRFTAGDDNIGDYRSSDKPYINDPNVQHLAWNRPRSVVLGLRIGF